MMWWWSNIILKGSVGGQGCQEGFDGDKYVDQELQHLVRAPSEPPTVVDFPQ
jgi:hypothetical protein